MVEKLESLDSSIDLLISLLLNLIDRSYTAQFSRGNFYFQGDYQADPNQHTYDAGN